MDGVAIGIETANDGSGTGQPMTVILYESSTNPPTLASLTLIAGASVSVPDSATGTLFNVALTMPPALEVATGILEIEVFTPNGQANSHSFFMGSNDADQSGPSLIRSAPCGIA